ncbi:homoserine dehydrogenase [Pedomonas mirosovicensis]|uniref:homoserine dehydrogenase n=1 Tax=Pedomonas mirosovicensis TaxID=2908641 RepID=UPI0035BC724F
MSDKPLRVGLAGLGTVGAGLVKLLAENAELVSRRANRPIVITAVSARDRSRDRGVDLSGFAWEDNAPDLAAREDVDTVVELIGGADGPALAMARAALSAGKGFVTANKAMLAHHGLELAQLAEKTNAPLKFEAAVAGGIPVVKGMREGMAGNRIQAVYGILNGTCNFILSAMEREGKPFDAVLKEAQSLGYAEADPTFDIDGIDAAHKLAILSSLAFGTRVNFAGVSTCGIRNVTPADIDYARALGYRIRLIGLARQEDGALFQRVHPCLVPETHPLAHVTDSLNAVVAEGNYVGRLLFQGRGAGEGPTASAVAADLVDVARGEFGPAFAMPAASLADIPAADPMSHVGRYYIRLTVTDRPGVLAELTAILRDLSVSVESVIQRGNAPNGSVYFVLTTHEGPQQAVTDALERIAALESVTSAPVMMHILEF